MEKSPNLNHHHARREFAEVVAPLEQAAHRRLGNPHRQECFDAFLTCPHGVRTVANQALIDADWGRNPVGLFIFRIKHGWHELEPLPDVEDAAGDAGRPDGDPALARWLQNVGVHYAHDARTFTEEIGRLGVGAEAADELRRQLLADEDAAA